MQSEHEKCSRLTVYSYDLGDGSKKKMSLKSLLQRLFVPVWQSQPMDSLPTLLTPLLHLALKLLPPTAVILVMDCPVETE